MTSHPSAATLGQLKETGYQYRTVKQEMRQNLMARLRRGEPLFDDIFGYDDSVFPQIIHAILSRHDMLLLGLRGQAKTRMIRLMPSLLDPWLPILAELDIPDDPLCPMTHMGQRLVQQQGDDTPIRWLTPGDRFHEKLATPDVTIADLIGEIDIVKHAEGRYLSDEATMHFGLIPRTNRGIFAINELPDLAPRIQVGLFNVLEERDVQIRGYPVRLNLDTCLIFSANPEDYTNRGRIVTPLKDRIGSVIRTHYPRSIKQAMTITASNAWLDRRDDASADGSDRASGTPDAFASPRVVVPDFLMQIVEHMVALARKSPHVNQASGVSVRASIASAETVASSAERRALVTGEDPAVARCCDLAHVVASCRGKVELMMAEDGQASEDKLLTAMMGEAVKTFFASLGDVEDYQTIADQFEQGLTLRVGDLTSATDMLANMKHVDGLIDAARDLCDPLELDADDPGQLAAAGELLLEALYVNNRLSKHATGSSVGYRR